MPAAAFAGDETVKRGPIIYLDRYSVALLQVIHCRVLLARPLVAIIGEGTVDDRSIRCSPSARRRPFTQPSIPLGIVRGVIFVDARLAGLSIFVLAAVAAWTARFDAVSLNRHGAYCPCLIESVAPGAVSNRIRLRA